MDRGLWHCTGDRDQDHPQEKEMQKGKKVVWSGLKNSWEKKRSFSLLRKKEGGKGEKKRYTHLNAVFQKIAQRDKKTFLSDQCKEIEENNRMERLRSQEN